MAEVDRTRLIDVAPFTAVSMGKVTSLSTSSGAIPLASVIMTTVGAVSSGNMSISIRNVTIVPAIISSRAPASTLSLFLNEKSMILSSMVLNINDCEQVLWLSSAKA